MRCLFGINGLVERGQDGGRPFRCVRENDFTTLNRRFSASVNNQAVQDDGPAVCENNGVKVFAIVWERQG
jgi:hypothetical protein